jgi:hypothetical protein
MSKKPYCKVCHDVGKPESEYSSHWVKDSSGKTICPTLLNTECRYCFKLGHTIKFCDVLAKMNKKKEKDERRNHVADKEQVKQTNQNKQSNIFATLCDDDSEEEEGGEENKYSYLGSPKVKKEEFRIVPVVEGISWVAIVASQKQVEQPTKLKQDNIVTRPKKPKTIVYAPWALNRTMPEFVTRSWADLSDSEDEEEILA